MEPLVLFKTVSANVLLKQLQRPLGPALLGTLPTGDASALISDASVDEEYDPMSRISLVTTLGQPLRWCGFDMLEAGDSPVSTMSAPVAEGDILDAHAALDHAVNAFASAKEPHFFFVREGNCIVGTLHYDDMMSHILSRLCFFALTAEIEIAALNLCRCFAEQCWQSLPDGRKDSAMRVVMRRGTASGQERKTTPSVRELLDCTMFCDKGTMIGKCRLLPDWTSRGKVDAVFSAAEGVRNACAHPAGGEDLLPRADLSAFFQDVSRMLVSIDQAIAATR